jgi:hypothetical protein
MPLMRLIEQHGGDAGEFGIGQDRGNENRLGDDQDARGGALLAVHAGEVADRLTGLLAPISAMRSAAARAATRRGLSRMTLPVHHG